MGGGSEWAAGGGLYLPIGLVMSPRTTSHRPRQA